MVATKLRGNSRSNWALTIFESTRTNTHSQCQNNTDEIHGNPRYSHFYLKNRAMALHRNKNAQIRIEAFYFILTSISSPRELILSHHVCALSSLQNDRSILSTFASQLNISLVNALKIL